MELTRPPEWHQTNATHWCEFIVPALKFSEGPLKVYTMRSGNRFVQFLALFEFFYLIILKCSSGHSGKLPP